MSYAIRNDGRGWRAVSGPGDVQPDETYAEELPTGGQAGMIWDAIRGERDRRRFDGGVQVGQHWYLSNSVATGEYSVLLQISAGLPDTTVLRQNWRTMDGGLVDMTPALARQIINAGFARVAEIDDAAQAHKAAMEASGDPASYDYSAGWPQTYAEWAAEQT